MRTLILALVAAGLSGFAIAQDAPVQLKPGPGLDAVEGNCSACHTLGYIQMNSPFIDEKTWRAEVTKMIKVFGAPIEDTDAETIVKYLATNYGPPITSGTR